MSHHSKSLCVQSSPETQRAGLTQVALALKGNVAQLQQVVLIQEGYF